MTGFDRSAGFWAQLPSLPIALISACFMSAMVRADDGTTVREYQVKAAFLFNFAKYGEWPPETLANVPFSICVLDRPELTRILNDKLAGRSLHDREVRIQELTADEASACHVLFIASSVSDTRQRALIASSRDQAMLLVGESRQFLAEGGAIAFFIADGTVHFDIDLNHASERRIAISSKLLRHAELVIGKATQADKTGAEP